MCAKNCSTVWILILSALLRFQGSLGECDLRYLREPVSTIACNPYLPSSMLRLQCDLQITSPTSSNGFQILWFFSRNGQSNAELMESNFLPATFLNSAQTDDNRVIITSSIAFNSSLLNSSLHNGRYYCRAALNNNFGSLIPSNNFILQSDLSYQSFQPCMGIQSSMTDRCARSILSATSTATPVTTITRSFGFNLRKVEEDLEIGFFVLILLVVMAIGLTIVILTVFFGKKCDKKKQTSELAQASDQIPTENMEIHINKLDSSTAPSSNSKDEIELKQDLGATTSLKKEGENQYKDPFISSHGNRSPSRESGDYVSMAGNVGIAESVLLSKEESIKLEPKEGNSSEVLGDSSLKAELQCAVVPEYHKDAADNIYEAFPEEPLPTGGVNPNADKKELEVSLTSKITRNPPELPPKNSTAVFKPQSQINKNESRRKDSIEVPKSTKESPDYDVPKPSGMQAKEDTGAKSAAVQATLSSKSSRPVQMGKSDYDIVPPTANILPNEAYGMFKSESQNAAQNSENIYEAIDDKEGHEDLYEDMK